MAVTIHREYILTATYLDKAGNLVKLYYDRFTKMWWPGFTNPKGYKTPAAANGQLTRMRKLGWIVPDDAAMKSWGWEVRETPLV